MQKIARNKVDAEKRAENKTPGKLPLRLYTYAISYLETGRKVFEYEGRLMLNPRLDPCPVALADGQWLAELVNYINEVEYWHTKYKHAET